MKAFARLQIKTNMQTESRKSPEEIVDDMLRLMPKEIVIPVHVRRDITLGQYTGYGFLLKEMPFKHKKACAWVEAMIKRERCAETFKTWGTGEQIAANHHRNIAKMKEMADRYGMTPENFSKAIKKLSSSTEQSRVGPSGFFPCPPEPQNQLSLDVLE